MLVYYKDYYENQDEKIYGLFDDWVARDREWGVELHTSRGRSKRGGKHRFFVKPPRNHWLRQQYDHELYSVEIRAYSSKEAIEIAGQHKKVEALYALLWQEQFGSLMANG